MAPEWTTPEHVRRGHQEPAVHLVKRAGLLPVRDRRPACLAEAKIVVESGRRRYNTRRPHSPPGYRPPAPQIISWPASPSGSASPATPAVARRPMGNPPRSEGVGNRNQPPPRRPRHPLQVGLHLRRGLSGPWGGRGPRDALRRHRGDERGSRRDRPRRRARRPDRAGQPLARHAAALWPPITPAEEPEAATQTPPVNNAGSGCWPRHSGSHLVSPGSQEYHASTVAAGPPPLFPGRPDTCAFMAPPGRGERRCAPTAPERRRERQAR